MKELNLFDNYFAKDINTEILNIADYIYTKTTLKPMSKTIFFLSRIMLLKRFNLDQKSYEIFIKKNNISDDYNFWKIYNELTLENREFLSQGIDNIISSAGTDVLGNLFNSLIHGKFEAGEGLGSFLTPDEVVKPTVELANYIIKQNKIDIKNNYVGDITGGTGNFLLHFYKLNPQITSNNLKIYDQSSLHLGFANINFLLHFNKIPDSKWTKDSLTDKTIHNNKFCCLLTNPPFGSNTYILDYKLDKEYKNTISIKEKTDPAWLFLIKNLEILSDKGLLAIILPNGIYQSKKFLDILKLFEQKNKCSLSIPFIFDLPVDTFSLAGTVAKTGVLFITKNINIPNTFHYSVDCIGFHKKGSMKIKTQNDYENVVHQIIDSESSSFTSYIWKDMNFLHIVSNNKKAQTQKLNKLATRIKDYVKEEKNKFIHIPVDAVDECGIIHFDHCLFNKMPQSKPIRCVAGDILVSCLNPRIWRVVKVPNIQGISWNCSSEFIVLRAKQNKNELFSILSSSEVKSNALKLAKGTSSSRQRINKEDFLNLDVCLCISKELNISQYEEIHKKLYAYVIHFLAN